MAPLNDPGFAQTNPGYVDRDPGFSKTMPGPDRDPGMTSHPKPVGPPRPSGIRPKSPSSPADRGNNSNRSVGGGIASTLFNSAKSYVTNLGRSVRDVPTAFGTALDTKGSMAAGTNGVPSGTAPIKNLATQIGQAAGAVVGKKDNSRSSQYYGPNKQYIDSKSDGGFYLNNPAKLGK